MGIEILKESDHKKITVVIVDNLDMRSTYKLLALGEAPDPWLKSCTIDLTGVRRVFDSGLALLYWFVQSLDDLGIEASVVSDLPQFVDRQPARGVPDQPGDHP